MFVLRHVQDLTSGGFRRDDDLWNSNTSTENGCEKERERRRARKWVVIVIYYINFHPARNGTSNKNETKDKVYLVFSVVLLILPSRQNYPIDGVCVLQGRDKALYKTIL